MRRGAQNAVILSALVNFVAVSAFHRLAIRPLVDGAPPPDSLPFGYSGETFRAWAEGLGQHGRELYLFGSTLTLDLSFPLLLAGFSIIILGRAARFGGFSGHGLAQAAILAVPLGAMAFDLVENTLVGLMLSGTARASDGLVTAASIATRLKYALHGLAFGLLVVMLLARLGRKHA